jgi:hypothetical protein
MGNVVQVQSKIKGVADIVFCIDSTGSMSNTIDNVKANVHTFAESIKNASPNTKVDWQARIIGYRDFNCDIDYIIKDSKFVNSPDALKLQLDKLTADGGGDAPESTLDALMYATLQSDWRPAAHKIIVLFTDAPPLPHLNSKTTSELGIPDDFEVVKQTLKEKRIKLFLFGPRDSIYEELSKESRLSITQYDDIAFGLQNVDFKSLLDTIGKTVSNLASSGSVK